MLNSGFVALFDSFPWTPNWAEATRPLHTSRAGLLAQVPCLGWMHISEPRCSLSRGCPMTLSLSSRQGQAGHLEGSLLIPPLLLQGFLLQHIWGHPVPGHCHLWDRRCCRRDWLTCSSSTDCLEPASITLAAVQAEPRKYFPNPTLVLFKTSFYLCCCWWNIPENLCKMYRK